MSVVGHASGLGLGSIVGLLFASYPLSFAELLLNVSSVCGLPDREQAKKYQVCEAPDKCCGRAKDEQMNQDEDGYELPESFIKVRLIDNNAKVTGSFILKRYVAGNDILLPDACFTSLSHEFVVSFIDRCKYQISFRHEVA